MPDGSTYTLFKVGERPVGGLCTPNEDVLDLPEMWLSYVNVENVDASVAKAKELGATIVKDRVDLPMGSFAVIKDPQGATFAFWKCNPNAEC